MAAARSEAPRTRRRSLVTRLAVATLTVGVVLVAGELAYRLLYYGPRALTPSGMNSCAPIGNVGALRASDQTGLSYELVPELDIQFKLVPLQTNAAGMRDREYTLEKPANVYRIAFLGDSFTMGSGVELEDVYHSILERELSQSRPVECLNFGVAGYGLRHYFSMLRHRALAYAPELVVVGVTPNDIRPAKSQRAEFVPRAVESYFFRWNLLHDTRRSAEPERAPDREDEAYVQKNFGRMAALARNAGVRLLIVSLRMHAGDDPTERAFRAAAAAFEIDYVDAGPYFEGDPSRYHIYRADAHPNAAANALYAAALRDVLEKRYLAEE